MTQYSDRNEFKVLTLGKNTQYTSKYSPELLQAVPRSLGREVLDLDETQAFFGEDVWHAYELSWLNENGKPIVALGRFSFSSASPNIIESKSFKLYLNSFNQTQFASTQAVLGVLIEDLTACCGQLVQVDLYSATETAAFPVTELPGICIDELDVKISDFELSPELLAVENGHQPVEETIHSHLLKSNCLITSQPDWASVVITYSGQKISHQSLLRYLVSFRMHNEFHEQCVERIYIDVLNKCSPTSLSVQALYTRRGGLDINPYRCSFPGASAPPLRSNRQ